MAPPLLFACCGLACLPQARSAACFCPFFLLLLRVRLLLSLAATTAAALPPRRLLPAARTLIIFCRRQKRWLGWSRSSSSGGLGIAAAQQRSCSAVAVATTTCCHNSGGRWRCLETDERWASSQQRSRLLPPPRRCKWKGAQHGRGQDSSCYHPAPTTSLPSPPRPPPTPPPRARRARSKFNQPHTSAVGREPSCSHDCLNRRELQQPAPATTGLAGRFARGGRLVCRRRPAAQGGLLRASARRRHNKSRSRHAILVRRLLFVLQPILLWGVRFALLLQRSSAPACSSACGWVGVLVFVLLSCRQSYGSPKRLLRSPPFCVVFAPRFSAHVDVVDASNAALPPPQQLHAPPRGGGGPLGLEAEDVLEECRTVRFCGTPECMAAAWKDGLSARRCAPPLRRAGSSGGPHGDLHKPAAAAAQ